ncbi:hypothetical protein [Escherichia phage pEC-M719-6WT.1]|uniref:Uncharacterized protein n=1 Tax=Escherichia phage pEC-M719-6WT.1 TaxID=3056220 RepID=A0AA51YCS6_9CAUD|nr:hypothetical protein [Escherichia phage pEC-M719-6WT.1]
MRLSAAKRHNVIFFITYSYIIFCISTSIKISYNT